MVFSEHCRRLERPRAAVPVVTLHQEYTHRLCLASRLFTLKTKISEGYAAIFCVRAALLQRVARISKKYRLYFVFSPCCRHSRRDCQMHAIFCHLSGTHRTAAAVSFGVHVANTELIAIILYFSTVAGVVLAKRSPRRRQPCRSLRSNLSPDARSASSAATVCATTSRPPPLPPMQ